jgi:hypothetical protein
LPPGLSSYHKCCTDKHFGLIGWLGGDGFRRLTVQASIAAVTIILTPHTLPRLLTPLRSPRNDCALSKPDQPGANLEFQAQPEDVAAHLPAFIRPPKSQKSDGLEFEDEYLVDSGGSLGGNSGQNHPVILNRNLAP